jgi:hypothetical protein
MMGTMVDSTALRSRRYRAHRQGDHHLCKHFSEQRGWSDASSVPPADVSDFDPAEAMAQLAGRLRDAYRQDPGNAALARELRMTLQAMTTPTDADAFGELQRWLSPG